ncbi:hypothetical protein KCU77_g12186, partial [Aureobasidium melanogenum]
MPTNDDFVSIRDDLGTAYVDEDDFTESNIEDMESDSEIETPMTIDYWFGKMYLRCTVAEELLHDSIYREPLDVVDSRLDTKIQQYPYDEVLVSLQAQGIARPDYVAASRRPAITKIEMSRTALLTLVGNIIRTGRRSERSALLACLRRGRGTGLPSHPREHLHTSTSTPRAESLFQGRTWPSQPTVFEEQHVTPSTEQDGPLEEMAKYTMTLKEYGDRIDAQPSYKTITISQYPPRFKSVVSFKGFEEHAESRTKKDAKHVASRKMCEKLSIRPA